MKTLTFDDLIKRWADPAAPADHAVREALAEHGAPGLLQELCAMLRDGEVAPADLEQRTRSLVSETLKTAPSRTGLGGAIAERREAIGMTQAELASTACVSISTVQKIEYGDNRPRLGTLTAIASALNATPDDLLRYTKDVT